MRRYFLWFGKKFWEIAYIRRLIQFPEYEAISKLYRYGTIHGNYCCLEDPNKNITTRKITGLCVHTGYLHCYGIFFNHYDPSYNNCLWVLFLYIAILDRQTELLGQVLRNCWCSSNLTGPAVFRPSSFQPKTINKVRSWVLATRLNSFKHFEGSQFSNKHGYKPSRWILR